MKEKTKSQAGLLAPAELRKFGLILAGGLIVLFGLLLPWWAERTISLNVWPWRVAAGILLVSVIYPRLLKPVYTAWMYIGNILGFINTRVILGIIYLFVFTPVALLLKLLRKDPLSRTLNPDKNSYRIESLQPKPKNLHRPY